MATADELPPQIVLVPLARSHPFNQRECTVAEPLKVGRPVDKKKIAPNNLIFDCRVLSRNHALIWYESGKFYIQDTKSSNGTFVNDSRLSPSGEESTPRELTTRDVVQFGVNVNVDKRVTHGCIIASIKLYVNGKELPGPDPDVQQIVQLVQNCLNKEQEFETKLVSMHEALSAAHALAKESMINIVKEDELLSRLEMLENQLHVYTRNISEDDLKRQLAKALEEKHNNTIASKEKVQLILQEKIDCSTRLSQVQRDYDKAEEECQKYKTLYEALKQEHSQQISKLSDQVKTTEKQKTELLEKIKEEKDLVLASQESVKSELERLEGQLKESQDKLSQANTELEMARERGYVPSFDTPAPAAGDNRELDTTIVSQAEGTEPHAHENVDRNGSLSSSEAANVDKVEEPVLMTLTAATVNSQIGASGVVNIEGNDKNLNDELQSSRTRMEELRVKVIELGATKKDLLKQLEELKDQLVSERQEKETLSQRVESQSKQLLDLQTRDGTVNPLEVQGITDFTVGSGGRDAVYRHKERQLEEQLKSRDNELVALNKEKDGLLSRVSVLENENRRLEQENNSTKMELERKSTESKKEIVELNGKLSALQKSLTEVGQNSTLSTGSKSLDPFLTANSPDPRIKILSIITLASIAVALLSATFAYFF